MCISSAHDNRIDIEEIDTDIEGNALEDMSSFNYFGTIVSAVVGTEEDMKLRIGKASHSFLPVLCNNSIRNSTKPKLFTSSITSVLLYGPET